MYAAHRSSVLSGPLRFTHAVVRALARRPVDGVASFLRELHREIRELHREQWEEVYGELMVFVEDQWRLMEEAPSLSQYIEDTEEEEARILEQELEALLEDCASEKGRNVR